MPPLKEAGHRGGLIAYDYAIHQKLTGQRPVQVTSPQKRAPIIVAPTGEHLDTKDSWEEYDTPYQEFLKGKEVFQAKARPRNESRLMAKVLDRLEHQGSIEEAVEQMKEGMLATVMDRLRRIISGNTDINPMEIKESDILGFIKNVRFDTLGKRKDEIMQNIAKALGIQTEVAGKMYDTVRLSIS